MKILTKTLLIAFSICFTFACNKNDQATENEDHMDHQEEMNHGTDSKSNAAVSFENMEISQVINSYLDLKDALVETDGEKAKNAASELLLALEKSNLEGKEGMEAEVKKIVETTDTEVQRASFDVLSNQMVELAKASVLTEGKLYKQYCPMAKNNEGAFWLSASNEIRNPYFGDKMLKCGSLEEEI